MDLQGVFLSSTISTVYRFYKHRNAGESGIRSVRYRNEKECRCWNQSGTGIKIPSPVPECSCTGLRCQMSAADADAQLCNDVL
jgi:hypothetical protein